MSPQETPPAKTDRKHMSWKRDHTVQHTGDTLAGRLYGHTPTVQGAAQPMHGESQGSRSEPAKPYNDIRQCSSECKGRPSGVSPSSRTVWE